MTNKIIKIKELIIKKHINNLIDKYIQHKTIHKY